MQHNQAIFESLFNRNFADDQHTVFLEELTGRHPYFSPAQFFLLQQVQDNTAAFEKQAIKTNIFFNNAHWLNFQLKQTGITVEEAPVIAAPAETVEEPVMAQPEPMATIEQEQAGPLTVSVDITVPEYEEKGTEAAEPEPITTSPDKNPEPPAIIDDLPDNTDAPDPAVGPAEEEIEPMNISLKMPEEKTKVSEAMLFEPMHMVDYFASQGIKLSEDLHNSDKLGKQLKSFTEWLKTMKKVHVPDEAEKAVNTDSSIQVLAESSNTEAEVLTESMAEVFARQGKIGKATEVYQKLSLLNPAKSTYFAAKIENLKGL